MTKLNGFIQGIARNSRSILMLLFIVSSGFRIAEWTYTTEVYGIASFVSVIVCFAKLYCAKRENTVWGAIRRSWFDVFVTVVIAMWAIWMIDV